MLQRTCTIAAAALLVILLAAAQPASAEQRVLLYSRTAGYRHASIPDAVKAFKKLGQQHNVHMYNTEDESKFEDEEWVNGWDALVFISVSGTALTNKGAVNMMKYIENGGGYMGIHEACDAMYKSPWYGRLLGAYFNYHPFRQRFTLNVETHDHPATSFLGDSWSVYDEVYTFNSDPRDLGKTVILTVDPKTYKDPGGDGTSKLRKIEGRHPFAWYKESGLLDEADNPKLVAGGGVQDTKSTPKNQRGSGGDGRSFYTALGHTHSCWKKDDMLKHVWGGLKWVLDSPSIRSNNASLPSTAPGTQFISTSNPSGNATVTTGTGSKGNGTSSSSASAGSTNATVPGLATSSAINNVIHSKSFAQSSVIVLLVTMMIALLL